MLKGSIAALLCLAGIGLLSLFFVFSDLRRLESRVINGNTDTLTELLALERTLGFGGFIHDFKNAVLRPDEPVYLDRAASRAAEALEILGRLENVMRSTGRDVDLAEARAVLERYSSGIAMIRDTMPGDVSAPELDSLIRRDDEEAIRAFPEIVERIRADRMENLIQIRNRMQQLSWMAAVSGLALLVGAGFLVRSMHRHDVEALRRLELANARVELALETATNGIIGLDTAGRITIANRVAREMLDLGNSPAPFHWPARIGFKTQDSLSVIERNADPIHRAIAGERLDQEIFVIASGLKGRTRYVRVSSGIVPKRWRERRNTDIRSVVMIEDVTEQETNRQKYERSSRLDALGQLTGGIAHDFNNILATIMYSIELSLEEQLPERARNRLSQARTSVNRGSELAHRLLTFAKRQPGLATAKPIGAVFSEMRSLVRPTIEETIEIVTECEDAQVMIFCDQGQLENAILNLVLNSRDAIMSSTRGNRILIAARSVERPITGDVPLASPGQQIKERARRYVEISVTDNGQGMSEEVKRRAIDPFFTTKGVSNGTGLGLSMVYGFVQQSDGEMRIYSEPGVGTTIRLLLPRGGTDGTREESADRLPVPHGKSERILLVEDDANLLAMMEDMLTSIGYRHISASDGQAAFDLVRDDAEFDLLLTDLVMPGGMDGFALARKVRALRPDIPVIYMSGYAGFTDGSADKIQAPTIKKPCSVGDLARVIRSVLNRSGQPGARNPNPDRSRRSDQAV